MTVLSDELKQEAPYGQFVAALEALRRRSVDRKKQLVALLRRFEKEEEADLQAVELAADAVTGGVLELDLSFYGDSYAVAQSAADDIEITDVRDIQKMFDADLETVDEDELYDEDEEEDVS